MIVDNVKLSNKNTPGGFMFDEPDLTKSFEFNFSSSWIVNSDNSEGITIDPDTNIITITKVKPNIWFMRSNYGFTSAAERNTKFYNKNWSLKGVAQANKEGLFTDVAVNGYNAAGLVITPMNPNGARLNHDYPWEMWISSGWWKNPNRGWQGYGYLVDGNELPLYNANPTWGNYMEVGLIIYTSVTPDEDGYINFSTPITIGCSMLVQFIDPTSKEAFTLALGKTKIYDKEKTFENLYMNHTLGLRYNNSAIPDAVQPVEGVTEIVTHTIESSGYVITTNKCPYYSSGKYKETGQPISIPVATDLLDIMDREPVKFFICRQTDDKSTKNGLWYNVVKYYKEHQITKQARGEQLFAGSNINGSDYTDGDGYLDIHLAGNDMTIDGMFDHAGMGYRNEGVEKVRIYCDSGNIANARDLFRFNKYRLKEVEFIKVDDPNEHICPKMMSGMFEYCGLPEFPKGLGFRNAENMMGLSESTCAIGFIAHSVAFKTFGNLKPDGSRYYVLVDPNCMYSFDTSYSPNDGPADLLEEILVDLDMKFVSPIRDTNAVQTFNCKNLKKARILNLNKGIWSLDGQHHVGSGIINGNLMSLDEDSTNYLLSNVFDLRTNKNADFSKSEFTPGLDHSSLYLPASLKERASAEAIKIATERGWDVYFGGELAEVAGGGGIGSTAKTLDVVFANKTSDEHELVVVSGGETAWQNYPKETWEPIGIVVVPGEHEVLKDGTGTKNQCGVMSLVPMDSNNPEAGGTSNQSIFWGGYSTDISGKSDGLGRYDSIGNGLTNYNKLNYVGKNGNVNQAVQGTNIIVGLPSDAFNTIENPYDKGTAYFYSNEVYAPSPYLNDGLFNQSYSQTISPASEYNALSDFKGVGNTKILTDLATAQSDWKVASAITNYSRAGYYPAACCCARFRTIGTKAFVDCSVDELKNGSGFWYFPSCGELGYMIVRRKVIDETLSKLISSYGVGVQISNNDYSYWSSSEISARESVRLYTYDGVVRYNSKDGGACIRAFMRL